MWGKLFCTSNPAKSEIFINDSSTRQFTPHTFTVLPALYDVKYRYKNHRDTEVLTAVSSSNTSVAKLTLVDTTIWKEFNYSNSRIPSINLSCIAIDDWNEIFVGTSNASFFSWNEKEMHGIPYPNILSLTINCITFDNHGALYAGTPNGMVYLYGSTWITYDSTNSKLPDYNIHSIVFNEGNCYIGTDKGITILKNWENFTPNIMYNGKKSHSHDYCSCR